MTQPADSPSTHRMLLSRGEFHDALRQALEQAASDGCRELFISDPDFSDWPLSEPAVVDSLTRWALPHRRLTVLAQNYDEMPRRHPRWVVWRRRWDHVVTCRALESPEVGAVPSLLLAPGLATVRLFDPVHYRASVSTHADDALRAREHLDALLQQSSDAFSASVLGL
jgi:hypothetical protein